jgi:hypothetical protein
MGTDPVPLGWAAAETVSPYNFMASAYTLATFP